MARTAKRELFSCEHCGNAQPLPGAKQRSVTCLKCGTVYAIVADDEGNRAVVPFYWQGEKTE